MVLGPAGDRRFVRVWAAPAALKTFPEGVGLRPPPSGVFFGSAGAVQTPKVGDFRPARKPCIKNPSVRPDLGFEFRCLRIGLPS